MLKKELQRYIQKRKEEQASTGKSYLHYFFGIRKDPLGLGYSAEEKISAAHKLCLALDGNEIKFSDTDIGALWNSRLGEIIEKHEAELPKCFLRQRQNLRDRNEDDLRAAGAIGMH